MEISSVLFAAGRGKRLRPLTDSIPKPALPLLDIPLAAWGLAALARYSPPVVVNVSHRADRVVAALEPLGLGKWEPFDEGTEAFGTAGTLRALRDRVSGRVVTWNGDALTDLHLPGLIEAHEAGGRPATLLVKEVGAGGDLTLERGSVTGFIDRREQPKAPGARFLGIAVFEREALDRLPEQRPAGLGETLLRDLAEEGGLNVHPFEGYLRDVGTPGDLLSASLDVLGGRAPAPPIELPGQIVEVAGGLAYLGPDANAAPGSLGPGAILLAHARVQPGARVTHSVVFPGVEVPTGTELRRAIWLDRELPPSIPAP